MPLLCLLLERVLWTMNIARISVVSPKEFSTLDLSIYMVLSSMRNRGLKLQGSMLRLLPFYHLSHISAQPSTSFRISTRRRNYRGHFSGWYVRRELSFEGLQALLPVLVHFRVTRGE